MDWKLLFAKFSKDTDLEYFSSISKEEVEEIENEIGVIVSGSLLEILKETNGIRDERDYYLYSSKQMIRKYREHLDHLRMIAENDPCRILFFADDGCGNGFGHTYNNDGRIETGEVVVYYPIDNEYRIIAPDLRTWVVEWYTGKLSV